MCDAVFPSEWVRERKREQRTHANLQGLLKSQTSLAMAGEMYAGGMFVYKLCSGRGEFGFLGETLQFTPSAKMLCGDFHLGKNVLGSILSAFDINF